jgi:hypothetical protein
MQIAVIGFGRSCRARVISNQDVDQNLYLEIAFQSSGGPEAIQITMPIEFLIWKLLSGALEAQKHIQTRFDLRSFLGNRFQELWRPTRISEAFPIRIAL